MTTIQQWNCLHLFPTSKSSTPIDAGVIVNTHLPLHFESLWRRTLKRVCADGGSNRLYDYFKRERFPPDLQPELVIGDLDSIQDEVRDCFTSLGTKTLHVSCQDSTDLEKAFDYLKNLDTIPAHIVVFGSGGSLSHDLGNWNASYKYPRLNTIFVGLFNISFVLQPGTHYIETLVGQKCSIIPLGHPTLPGNVKSKGLKWNLDHLALNFGGILSNSNESTDTQIIIHNDVPILFLFDFD